MRVDYTLYDSYDEFERGGKQKIKKTSPKIKKDSNPKPKNKIRKKNNKKQTY